MTFEERVLAMEAWGFLPRQARFLVTVALHSGYCLRRQYTAFTGTQNGKNVQRFLEGLVARRLAVRMTYRPDRGHIYHLHSWSLYRALGHQGDRNRRHASAALIARKLMLLDVVLSQPEAEWVATEADKVALFTNRFHAPLEDLPRRTFVSDGANPRTTRYFMHKLPIAVVGDPPIVHFVYLATDGETVPFEWFLREHARLLSALPAWVVVVAHPSRVRATHAWDAVFGAFMSGDGAITGSGVRDLERYFVARKAVERNELARLSVADLQTFRTTRLGFAEPRIEALFSRWVASGEARLDPTLVAEPVPTAGRLVIHPLAHSYEQFGAYAGLL
jgi:hypothetical protein